MALTAAERNRKKRERKKRLRDERREREKSEAATGANASGSSSSTTTTANPTTTTAAQNQVVEIEYIPEQLPFLTDDGDNGVGDDNTTLSSSISKKETTRSGNDTNGENSNEEEEEDDGVDINAILRRFNARSSVLVSDDDEQTNTNTDLTTTQIIKQEEDDDRSTTSSYQSSNENDTNTLSKRKMREQSRPTVAELKTRVERADLVEAHDVASRDPDFLLRLKAVPGTVAVPRHWGRKRKYLQGKRGVEKAPFQLPDFIVKTGISVIRSAIDEDENDQNAKSKNRSRVAPKMGKLDVDYRTLHDAFFKHQNRQIIRSKLTKHGDLYYEGKEYETQKAGGGAAGGVGGALSEELREALGMANEATPPPWLVNMQRYGPPPSYPNLKIPGLNAPLPAVGCSYGYHLGGWGKPPVDAFGRPLYGGNPFDAPGSSGLMSTADWDFDASSGAIVTSDGKTIGRKPWGVLPMAGDGDESEGEESSSGESSSGEDSDGESSSSGESMGGDTDDEDDAKDGDNEDTQTEVGGTESVLPGSAVYLRKEAGDETPAPLTAKKQLYEVLQQTVADGDRQKGAVFSSDVAYVIPGGTVPEGAESVLSKVAPGTEGGSLVGKRNRTSAEDGGEDDGELGKKFKF
mmetsp:Transcript_24378/g.28727  ORF Transcript_24378/g.28727 Transcript_24378/m.28727 type:complete len:632 (-) Transcript_24378:79-1974(-)